MLLWLVIVPVDCSWISMLLFRMVVIVQYCCCFRWKILCRRWSWLLMPLSLWVPRRICVSFVPCTNCKKFAKKFIVGFPHNLRLLSFVLFFGGFKLLSFVLQTYVVARLWSKQFNFVSYVCVTIPVLRNFNNTEVSHIDILHKLRLYEIQGLISSNRLCHVNSRRPVVMCVCSSLKRAVFSTLIYSQHIDLIYTLLCFLV